MPVQNLTALAHTVGPATPLLAARNPQTRAALPAAPGQDLQADAYGATDACTPVRSLPRDVVDVPLERCWVRPWRRHPPESATEQGGRVPLDIDDVAGVMGRLLGDSPVGPVLTCSLLLLGAYFSASSGVGACHLYVDLQARREALRRRLEAIDTHLETAANTQALAAWRNVCARDAVLAERRQWLQIPCAVGGTLMAISILCSPHLLGRFSESVETVGAALTWVGAPAMILFTAGTGVESALCARAHSTQSLAQKRAAAAGDVEPWATAALHTEARGNRLFQAHMITSLSGLMMATGLGLIYGIGAWGLAAMLPGLVGLQFGMRGRQKHTQTGDAASAVAPLVHDGSLKITASRIGEVAQAIAAARAFAPNDAHAEELHTWVERVRDDDLFEDWAVQLGHHEGLRDALGIARRNSVSFAVQSLAAQTVPRALRPAVAAALASTYTGAGVQRLGHTMRVLMDFYVEQLKLAQSAQP